MPDLMTMMLLSGRGMNKDALRTWAMKERQDRIEMYPKILKLGVYGAYVMWGSLKLKVQMAGGAPVDATDPSVSATGKANATLEGIAQLYRQSWWQPLIGEFCELLGTAFAKATSMDPILLDAMSSQAPQGTPQSIQITSGGGGMPMWGPNTGRTVTVMPPGGGRVPMRMTANGISVDAPGWNVEVE